MESSGGGEGEDAGGGCCTLSVGCAAVYSLISSTSVERRMENGGTLCDSRGCLVRPSFTSLRVKQSHIAGCSSIPPSDGVKTLTR